MRTCKLSGGLVTMLVLLVGLPACGGGAGTSTQGAATSQGTTQTTPATTAKGAPPARWETGKTPTALADAGGRLEQAGYTPVARTGTSPEIVRVTMHAGAWAYLLTRPKGTTPSAMARSIRQLNTGSRGRLAATMIGDTVYVASSGDNILNGKKRLSASQVAEFHKIVGAASGQR
jgi:hypothetical protein